MVETIDVKVRNNVVEVRVTGRLSKESYDTLVPAIDRVIEQQGKIRVLFAMHDFHGWTPGALWADLKFDVSHWRDIQRLAIVGENKWEEAMAHFCKPFTSAKIQYFPADQIDQARQWLGEP